MIEPWTSKQRMLDAIAEAEGGGDPDNTPLDITWPDFHDDADASGASEGVGGHVHGDVPTVYMSLDDPTVPVPGVDRKPSNVKPGDKWIVRDNEEFV